MRYKFLRQRLCAVLLAAAASSAFAQDTSLGAYHGPGISNRGAGDLGSRSGEQVDLRYYAGVSGIVDTNLQPFVLDAQGNLLRIHNLYGVEVSGGAYGVHRWKRTELALDYRGSYHRYVNEDVYNTSDQTLTLGYATALGSLWIFSIEAGVSITEVVSPFSFALDPVLAAFFGQSTLQGTTYLKTTYPSGAATLKRRFQNAALTFHYFRGLNSGNGAFAAGRSDNVSASIGYTGIRKVDVGLDGGYDTFSAIGQSSGRYTVYSGAAGLTYRLGHDIYWSLRYDLRNQQIDATGYRRTSSRASIGLLFSPGTLPLALW
jgi:hypothetical protein